MVCVARPEFLEAHPGWGTGKPNSTTITLDPLDPAETGTLIATLLEIEALPDGLRSQIIDRSAGTPLFCEEFIRMLIDEGRLVRDGASWRAVGLVDTIRVPDSVQAVLAARLDGLPEAEKTVLQAASVVGERFGVAQVRNLVMGSDVEAGLESLRRKSLVTGGDRPGEEMRFSHLLVRDAAYASLPKSQRAALHDRFGSVLESEAGDPQQVTEILAHHAERALTLSIELALEGDSVINRARRALEWSLAMGERAMTRRDRATIDAALNTARAASAILPDAGGLVSRTRMALLETELLVIAADYPRAIRAIADAAAMAEKARLPMLVAKARLAEAWITNWTLEGSPEEFREVAERAVEACRQAGDPAGEIEARHVGAYYLWGTGRVDDYIAVNRELLERARSIGDVAHEGAILVRLGPAEAIRGNLGAGDAHLAEAARLAATFGLREIERTVLWQRGGWYLLSGDLAAAERFHREFLVASQEAGAVQHQVSAHRHLANVLMYAQRYGEAAQSLERAAELSEASGERWNRSEIYAMRARAAFRLGDLGAAEVWMGRALATLREYDVTAVSEVHQSLGLIRAAQGRTADAEFSLRRSLSVLDRTEYNWIRAEVAVDLARFLAQTGRTREAADLIGVHALWASQRDIHLWDRDFEEIRALTD